MRRLVLAIVGAALAIAAVGGMVSAATPPANSPWEYEGYRCITPNGMPGVTYLNSHADRSLCFEV